MAQRRRRFIFLGVIALLVVIVVVRLVAGGGKKHKPKTLAIPVRVTAVKRQDVPVYLTALGTVVAYRTVVVQPMITGPLVKVLFHEGQFVKAGQLLAEIDTAPYQAALAQAKAKLAQDQASAANAALQARQYASLVKQNYTSKQQAATAQATLLEARGLVQQDEATIATDKINLGYTKILAPISGKTGILQVNAGNIVTPNLTNGIVTINTLQPISVQFSLPQQDLMVLRQAMAAGTVTLLASDEGGGAGVAGTGKGVVERGVLSLLDNTINSSTGTLTAKGRFANKDEGLWPGGFVNVHVLVKTIAGAMVVPPDAVEQGPDGSFVYLITAAPKGDKDAKAKVQPVSLGYQGRDEVVITKGLTPGDQVVTEGGARLTDGSLVQIVTAAPHQS
jgi:multidrug efflux system membrane fusion protein